MSAPKPYMNNRFAVLSAPDSADEENQNEAEFQEQEAGKPLKAASLDGLEDKPKAPICAAQMITIEDPVPVLNYVLVDPQVSLLPSLPPSLPPSFPPSLPPSIPASIPL